MNTLGGFMYSYTKYQEGQKTEDENFNKVKIGFHPTNLQDTQDVSRENLSLSEIKIS